MLSVKEIKKRLPKEFIDNLYKRYTPVQVDNILLGMTENRFTSLRVNSLKFDIQSLMKYLRQNNIKFERVRLV